MAFEADLLIDRRRLKRRLAFWRLLAVLSLAGIALLLAPSTGRFRGLPTVRHIARLRIDGVIGDGRDQAATLDRLANDGDVAAVLLHLDTPGGAVSGGEGLHDAVAQLAARKPVVAVMDGTAASAGYMIAVACPYIVARESTLTGSIGVILELGDIGGLLDRIGVHADPIVSGPLKGQPSFTKPLSAQGHDVLQALVMDLYDQFVGMVAHGRHMDEAAVRKLADGRAYTGRQAKALGLVDEIGGETQAVAWLEHTRHLSSDLPVHDAARGEGWTMTFRSAIDGLVVSAREAVAPRGAYALWQPGAQ